MSGVKCGCSMLWDTDMAGFQSFNSQSGGEAARETKKTLYRGGRGGHAEDAMAMLRLKRHAGPAATSNAPHPGPLPASGAREGAPPPEDDGRGVPQDPAAASPPPVHGARDGVRGCAGAPSG